MGQSRNIHNVGDVINIPLLVYVTSIWIFPFRDKAKNKGIACWDYMEYYTGKGIWKAEIALYKEFMHIYY